MEGMDVVRGQEVKEGRRRRVRKGVFALTYCVAQTPMKSCTLNIAKYMHVEDMCCSLSFEISQ